MLSNKRRDLLANKKQSEMVQYFCFFHTIVATLISVSIMTNTQTDFLADEFLLDEYVGKTPLVRLQRLACLPRPRY